MPKAASNPGSFGRSYDDYDFKYNDGNALQDVLALRWLGSGFNATAGGVSDAVSEADRYMSAKFGADWTSLPVAVRKKLLEDNYASLDSSIYGFDDVLNFLGGETGRVNVYNAESDFRKMLDAQASRPEKPLLESFLESAQSDIAAEDAETYAMLDELMNSEVSDLNSQLSNLSSAYEQTRKTLLSQQAQQNSQLMDTLQSGMERSRRNALEAGASAGIRIADNINTLLSVQNKQSATSMETANQLAQMMISQRNAEAGIRSDYSALRRSDAESRMNIKNSAYDRAYNRAQQNYGVAADSYSTKEESWKSDNAYNPFYEAYSNKPKYSTGGT